MNLSQLESDPRVLPRVPQLNYEHSTPTYFYLSWAPVKATGQRAFFQNRVSARDFFVYKHY